MRKYIAIVGMPGVGKNLAAEHLKNKYGYFLFDLRDVVAEEVRKEGLPITKESMHGVSMRLRREEGPGVVAKRAVQQLAWYQDPRIFADPDFKVIFNGIRNPEEIDYLRERYGDALIVVGLTASRSVRYKRMIQRDGSSIRDVEERDRKEVELFGIGDALVSADYILVNEDSPEELFAQLDKVIESS